MEIVDAMHGSNTVSLYAEHDYELLEPRNKIIRVLYIHIGCHLFYYFITVTHCLASVVE